MFVPAAPVLSFKFRSSQAHSFVAGWLPPGRAVYTANGRSALMQAFQELGLARGFTALLPAYLCGSVLAPFRAYDCQISLYPINCRLQFDSDELATVIKAKRPQVVLLVHYMGFPTAGLNYIKQLCQQYDAFLIEDCAHGLFSAPGGQALGSIGDASVFSLRKSLAIPEGEFWYCPAIWRLNLLYASLPGKPGRSWAWPVSWSTGQSSPLASL